MKREPTLYTEEVCRVGFLITVSDFSSSSGYDLEF